MNEARIEEKMEKGWKGKESGRDNGRLQTGIFLLLIGALLFLKTSHLVIFPSWFFSNATFFIALGLFIGLRKEFRPGFWLIFLLIGGFSLADKIDPDLRMDKYMWPLIIMGIGLAFIFRPKKAHWGHWKGRHHRNWNEAHSTSASYESFEGDMPSADRRDFIEATAVFGGVKKSILSKNFKGGEITSVMGGSEIDLTQADFTGTITIEITTAFGGSKLIVPPTWDVHNEISAVFGGVDDKRQIMGVAMDPNKVLILEGTCIFGGLEIRSY
ncbi:MAG: hypothetical protein JWP69_191 [Flaviaesturariibacter sp.]|nr:hypothetical protein [Flaviaesturariibacter sp.]